MKRGQGFEKQAALLAEDYPISIVVPAHDAARDLPSCLQAIECNDLRNVEVLVVDDASSDATREIVLASGFRCVELKTRQGPSGARNAGIRESRCPHVFFVDADVVLPSRAVQWIRESLDLYKHRGDVAGVLGQYAEQTPTPNFLTSFKNLSTCYLYHVTDTLSPYLHTPICCVSRSVLMETGGFEAGLTHGEDFRLGAALGVKGYHFVIDRRIKGVHLKRYSLPGIMREDWRRVRQLASLVLSREEKKFAYKAHRWNRLLSVALPGLVLIGGLLAFLHPLFPAIAGLIFLGFLILNVGFLSYCRRLRGGWFATGAAGFLFAEMLWAQLALAASLFLPKRRSVASGCS